jgi:hypothetical protein
VKDGEHQPHLHVLFSERTDHGKDVDAETYFRRPEVGGCAKDRWFHQRNSAYALRESWADWCNYTLEAHHHAARVHPRSLYARDIDRKPEPKVGYSSDPALHARRVEIQQARDVAQEQALAAAGWEARKRQLGTTHLAPEAFLACSVARARQMQPGRAYGPMLTRKERQQFARDQEYERLTGALAQVERQLQDIQDARQGQPVPVGRVMAALAAAEADDVARGLRAHIFAKEDSYGR